MNTEPYYMLYIDDREHGASDIIDGFNVPYVVKRIEIGDYCIMDNTSNNVRAVFERKTIQDQAASLKDGRHDNKTKLLELRAQISCDVYYIIENNKTYHDESIINGMTYKTVLNSIYSIIVRDKIHVLYTKNMGDTIHTLCELVKSYTKHFPCTASNTVSMTKITDAIRDQKIIRDMWCSINGINKQSYGLLKQYSFIDIFCKRVNLSELLYPSGRRIPQSVLNEINNISKASMINIMSVVSGITPVIADALVNSIENWELCTENTLGEFKHNGRRLGKYGRHLFALLSMSQSCDTDV